MNAKPELEIFADDVVCGHGATVGSLDPEQLFYLMARGIAKDEAVAMLLRRLRRRSDRSDRRRRARGSNAKAVSSLAREARRSARGEGDMVSKEAVS